MLSLPAELARGALDAAPDAIIIIDADGAILYANQQVTALFGFAHPELIGRSVESLMPERFRGRHIEHRAGYAKHGRVRPMGTGLELLGLHRDGSEFPIEISLSPIRSETTVLVAAAIRDATERKRTEAELVVARQVAEQARETADRANSAKTRFLATASHDLRQPLQTLALLNGTLRRMMSDTDTLQAVSQQEQAIAAMSRLLNALLDISKLESGAVQPEPVDFRLASLFEELQRQFAQLASEKGLQLTVQVGEEIAHSDPAMIEQILRNLLANAIKYTAEGSVTLDCQGDGKTVRIEVRDTGPGIPADQQRFIFDEFYQVSGPGVRKRDGYGLGLNIVQRIVKLLDVDLELSSETGKGTSFTLALPSGTEHPKASHTPSTPVPQACAPPALEQHVLLVEDDAAVRNATRLLLRVEGYRVTAVSSVGEAMQHLAAQPVDLLITDYHLEGDEVGTSLITAARQRLGQTLKAVLMTGDTSAAVRTLPADPYLRVASKPIKAEALLLLLRSFPAA